MNINFKMRGNEKVEAFIASLPRGVVEVGLTALVEYFTGDSAHGLKHPDPYKYPSRHR